MEAGPRLEKPLEGRVAVVTGVSRRIGIGYAVARRLAHHWSSHDAGQPWGADPLEALTAAEIDLSMAVNPGGAILTTPPG